MEVRINYTIKDYEDSYMINGDTVEDIQRINKQEMAKRGLDSSKNNMWSEEL